MEVHECLEILKKRNITNGENENSHACTTLPHQEETESTCGNDQELNSNNQDLTTLDTKTIIKKIFTIQEQRARTFAYFESEFKDQLENNNLEGHPILCQQVTERFAEYSRDIISIENHFKGNDETISLAKLLRNAQELEKEKLYLCAALQLERIRKLSATSDMRGTYQHSIESMQKKMYHIIEEINELLETLRYEL